MLDVKISELQPHPGNPNEQTPQTMRKLTEHIRTTNRYPAIVVRTFCKSERFAGQSGYQILDGEHRWRILKALGRSTARIDNWGDLTDDQADQLLVTMNQLRGKDNKSKRATILSLLRDRIGLDRLSELVPETISEIEEKIEMLEVEPQTEEAINKKSDEYDPWSCLMSDDMTRVVNAAVKLRQSKGNLPGEKLDDSYAGILQDYDRGRALYDICAEYVLRQTGAVK